MSTPSTPKATSLAARLQADQAAIQRQFASQTQHLLSQHAACLKKLSSDARHSMRGALELHRAEIDNAHKRTLTHMRWLLLWPVAMTVMSALLIVLAVAGWTSLRLDQIDQAQGQIDQAIAALVAQQQAAQQVPRNDQLQLRKRR